MDQFNALGSVPVSNAGRAAAQNFARLGAARRQGLLLWQGVQRRMAKFGAQPEGTGHILCAAALLVVHWQ